MDLYKKMVGLLNTAKMVAFFSKIQSIGDRQYFSGQDEIRRGISDSACIDFLFGDPQHPDHRDLDIQAIRNEAVKWIEGDPLMRELVIQSLRVFYNLGFMKNGVDAIPDLNIDWEAIKANKEQKRVILSGIDILRVFGPDFPIGPDPENYEELVMKAFATLPPGRQAEVRSRSGFGGL